MKTNVEISPDRKKDSITRKITRPVVFIALALALSFFSSCAIFVGEHHEGRTHGAGVIVK